MVDDSKTTTSPDVNSKREAELPELVSASKKPRTLAEEKQTSEANNNSNNVSSNENADSSQENEHKDKNVEERRLSFAVEADAAEDKGSRHTMEDAWVVLQDASLDFPGKLRCAHFAIYDGHGGRLAAEYAKKNLHRNVLSAGLPRELLDVKAAKKAILEGFRKTDESLLQESTAGGWQDGATAVCVWVLGQTVFVANIGDAKAVIARSTVVDGSQHNSTTTDSLKAIVLTREHKAIYPQERARIQKAGGTVSSNGRLQGRLEVSRAFGDRQFKKVGVVATPDIHSFDLTERDHFIILGCDGLWGVFGPSDAVEFVRKLLQDGLPVAVVSRHLVREAVRERRCKDNCTAIVIVFRKN
ncbi:probable protein phosphatase 2C 8 [Coffea eugenioides]|uniref:probable protein phosphatase 2C 8 n=1 Tax=Coffea eugenioides TaxID=49369 RepID=UPI000F5D3E18|nr:probable protein phosphatase 2C 8 [Coffea arabica]XP_027167506.1 probable protein phosphatase 2C 8 [Coffea eugenioides]